MRSGPQLDLIKTYSRRCSWPMETVEVVSGIADEAARKRDETARLLSAVPANALVVATDERGRDLDSAAFARLLGDWRDEGQRDIAFLIGGADGLDDTARRRARLVLAFGRMTWPHELARVLLAEQIYRASTILAGHPYHRA